MKVRAHVYISGRVQGVFFRSSTKDVAIKLKVNGWVRNLSDGQVEAIFEGNRENVESVIKYCRKGPPKANVISLKELWETYTGEFKNFKIR